VSSPADQQIKEVVGSGPFKFAKDEWQPGEQVVYVRNSDYIAREEPPSGSTGGKKAYLEKVILAVHRRTLGRGEVLTLEGRPLTGRLLQHNRPQADIDSSQQLM
jgi:hypothetical protein